MPACEPSASTRHRFSEHGRVAEVIGRALGSLRAGFSVTRMASEEPQKAQEDNLTEYRPLTRVSAPEAQFLTGELLSA